MKRDSTSGAANGASTWRAFAIAAALLGPCAPSTAADAAFTEGHLWRISKPGAADSFVLGTIHIADPRIAAIPKPALDALARSRVLALELAPGGVAEAVAFEQETQDDGRRLEPLIGADAYARLEAELLAAAIPKRVIETMKPWAAMMKVAQAAPPAGMLSLDEQLFVAARERRMPVMSLEMLEEQIAAFDAIPLDSQVALLKHVLAHRDAVAATIEPTIDAWLRGDLLALARVEDRVDALYPGMGRHYRQLAKHIIDDRTVLMHHRLYLPLRSGRVFVAIGMSHLHGEAGLLAMLQRDGFRVTRIW